jgi:hypothetical protein
MNKTTKLQLVTLTLAIACSPALAQSFFLSVDNPTDLGATYLSSEILRNDTGAYASILPLAADVHVNAVYRTNAGGWLFAVEAPVDFGGGVGWAEPRDVVELDASGTYGKPFSGAAWGVPAGIAVDALFLDGGDWVMSFDAPVDLVGRNWLPADLVRWNAAGFDPVPYFDSVAAGIPRSSNVTGADLRGGDLILTFDVHTDIPGGPFLPGQLVAWNGAAPFVLYYAEAAWPITSRLDALSFLAEPGTVPTLQVAKKSATELTVSWSDSCSPGGVDDYAIYRGTLGSWYSHQAFDCADSDGVPLSEDVPIGSGSYYYLVVGTNANDEGSYGLDSAGFERPAGSPTCGAVTQELGCP